MNLPNIKKFSLISTLLVGILGIAFGNLLLWIDPNMVLKIIFVVMGIVTILSAIPTLFAANDGKVGRAALIVSVISILFGVLMIFWHENLLMILLGAYLLLLPLVEILVAREKLLQLKRNLPQMIVGLVLILLGPNQALGVVLNIAGWIVILLSVLYVVISVFSDIRRQTKREATTGNRIFVDNTGDGEVDVVYVDTTGDGRPDTAKRYRKKK